MWLNASGKATIKPGRLFVGFDDGGKLAVTDTMGAWTVQFVASAAASASRDYKAEFASKLPEGTELTLICVTTALPYRYYHYTVPAGGRNTVAFSEFTLMGTLSGNAPVLSASSNGDETYLLSADFSRSNASASNTPVELSFKFVNDGTDISLGANAVVSYRLDAVTKGVINAEGSTITLTAQPAGAQIYEDDTVYLVASVDGEGTLNASASLRIGETTIDGTWISRTQVAFDLGSYGSLTNGTAYAAVFENLEAGNRTITWRLYSEKATNAPNILRSAVSESITSTLTVEAVRPSLEVTTATISRVNPREVTFTYTSNVPGSVTVEKQKSVLSDYEPVSTVTLSSSSFESGSGEIVATFPSNLSAGTYRIRFSVQDGSNNDDVYFSFIVE